jgi:hypothetical protein
MSATRKTPASTDLPDQPDAKRRRDERARRREERSRVNAANNIDLQEYVNHICGTLLGDISEPAATDFTNKSFEEKNIERGDLVWLGPRCTNVVGVVFAVSGNKAVVQLFTTAEWKVTTLNSSDVELKRKAKNTKKLEDFRRF